jgi:pyruvate dehydrogenase E1 component beta subunit
VKRAGRDVTVVATSLMVRESPAAAEILAKDGIEIEVVDPRTIVAEQALHAFKAPPVRVARPSAPLGYAPTLEKAVTPDAEKIVAAVRRMLKK